MSEYERIDSMSEDMEGMPVKGIAEDVVIVHTKDSAVQQFLYATDLVSIGSKWISGEKQANQINPMDNVLIRGVWYLVDYIEIK